MANTSLSDDLLRGKINFMAKSKKVDKYDLKKSLQEHFGFDKFKDEQQEIIESVLDGKDTFVIMPTGGGKSLCYQLPALLSEGIAIIVSPLIALMKNQVDLLRSYSDIENVAHFMNSSLNKGQIKKVKEDLLNGGTKMLYVAPETLTKEDNVEFLKQLKISFIATRLSSVFLDTLKSLLVYQEHKFHNFFLLLIGSTCSINSTGIIGSVALQSC